jgi:hypothetical protein
MPQGGGNKDENDDNATSSNDWIADNVVKWNYCTPIWSDKHCQDPFTFSLASTTAYI